jgi:hypothetical protein
MFYVTAIVLNGVDIATVSATNDWVYNNTSLRLYAIDMHEEREQYNVESIRGDRFSVAGPTRTYVRMTLGVNMLDVMYNNDIVHRALRTEEGRMAVADAMVDDEIPEIIERRSLLDPLSEY